MQSKNKGKGIEITILDTQQEKNKAHNKNVTTSMKSKITGSFPTR